jgi:hypothetical protein
MRATLAVAWSNVFSGKPDEQVCSAAVDVGTFWAEKVESVKAALVEVAARDSSENLRKIATASVSRLAQE